MLRWLFLLFLLSVLFAGSDASTSSTLLKQAVKTSSRTAVKARGVAFVNGRTTASSVANGARTAVKARSVAFVSGASTARPFFRAPSSSTATASGFRSFSRRATRLQTRLQKSFSLRAIFSDVITNHPGRQTPASAISSTNSMPVVGDDLMNCHRIHIRRPFHKELQRIAAGTLRESWEGFVGGYALATGGQFAKRCLSQVFLQPTVQGATATGHVLPYPFLTRLSQEVQQMHSHSTHFGGEWAQMSAVFGASRLLVQTLRGKQDEWNTVAGSALAGAVFACQNSVPTRLPPVAMARGALLYSTSMFFCHPNLWKPAREALLLTTPTNEDPRGCAIPFWDGVE